MLLADLSDNLVVRLRLASLSRVNLYRLSFFLMQGLSSLFCYNCFSVMALVSLLKPCTSELRSSEGCLASSLLS